MFLAKAEAMLQLVFKLKPANDLSLNYNRIKYFQSTLVAYLMATKISNVLA